MVVGFDSPAASSTKFKACRRPSSAAPLEASWTLMAYPETICDIGAVESPNCSTKALVGSSKTRSGAASLQGGASHEAASTASKTVSRAGKKGYAPRVLRIRRPARALVRRRVERGDDFAVAEDSRDVENETYVRVK